MTNPINLLLSHASATTMTNSDKQNRLNKKNIWKMSADSISKQVLEKFWKSFGQKRISFLPGSVERDYIMLWRGIQNFKIHTEGNKLNLVGILTCRTV